MIVVSLKYSIKNALLNHKARDVGGGRCVVYLDSITDIERVFEKNEDTTTEEFLDCATSADRKTNSYEAYGLPDLFDARDIYKSVTSVIRGRADPKTLT